MMMRRRLFAIGKTSVYLHLATLLSYVYMVAVGAGSTMMTGMLSILLHEAAHASVAALFGMPPAEIELTPLGALMRLEDEESLPPVKRLLMLVAGPAMSLLLCWLAIILTRCGLMNKDTGRGLFFCNMAILAINLLPALPLDGGRVLSLLLSTVFKAGTVRSVMRILGTVIGLVCLAGNVALTLLYGGWNFSLAIAGCFLMYAGAVSTTTAAMAEMRMFMDRKIRLEKRGHLPCRWVTVTDRLPLRQAIACLHTGCHTMYQMVESGTMKSLVQFSEDRLISAYLATPSGDCSVLSKQNEY